MALQLAEEAVGSLQGAEVVGLLFAAAGNGEVAWEVMVKAKREGQRVQLCLVSMDESEAAYDEWSQGVDALKVPFQHPNTALLQHCCRVDTAPVLVLFHASKGLLNYNAVSDVEFHGSDGYPWKRDRCKQMTMRDLVTLNTMPCVLLFVDPNVTAKETVQFKIDMLQQVCHRTGLVRDRATAERQLVHFFYIYSDTPLARQLHHFLRTSNESLVYTDLVLHVHCTPLSQALAFTEDVVYQFVDSCLLGEVEMRCRTEEEPKPVFGTALTVATAASLPSLLQSDMFVLLCVYASFSHKSMHVVDQLRRTAEAIDAMTEEKHIIIAVLNAEINDVDAVPCVVEELPTLILFPPEEYAEVERSNIPSSLWNAVGITEFLQQHVGPYVPLLDLDRAMDILTK